MSPARIPDGTLEVDLHRLGEQLDRIPRARAVEPDGQYSLPTNYNYFESFGDALAQAGFSPKSRDHSSKHQAKPIGVASGQTLSGFSLVSRVPQATVQQR
ncbi:hypothetical protein SAMN05216559_1897 [Halomicrobium zhouii]|uniref:Uncharacterized protein n=1 Tax=Halomicrobium zhouii TaxID=767519 RepID=A0A1I6L2L2_9EURY|nr:hypothetical protein SAMN05216559_1897 [Halomicrobium zhouii]